MNTVVTVLAALGGLSFVGTAINAYAQRRAVRAQEKKTGADATAVLTETATELLVPLREELRMARRDNADLRRDLADTRAELGALRTHLVIVEDLLRQKKIPVPEFAWPHHGDKL